MNGIAALSQEVRGVRRMLASIGRFTRMRVIFLLQMAALSWGVAREALRPLSWRPMVRAEFRRVLSQAAGGGLPATLFTAALVGLVMVSQALYWLGEAGEEELIGSVLVTILVREVAPLLIGLIILGRSGVAAAGELGAIQLNHQTRVLSGQGIDLFAMLVMPRVLAFALASFTLGVIFVLVALIVGFVAGSLLGPIQSSIFSFLDRVLEAMRAADFLLLPAKLLSVGFVVALVVCLTGLTAVPGDRLTELLPRAFARGVLTILIVSLVLSLAA
ncbi:MAG TPA: ABC transporter permease [Stellaceae bacterium]|nr:ABC transporter permease [Stellaceae bacterium]